MFLPGEWKTKGTPKKQKSKSGANSGEESILPQENNFQLQAIAENLEGSPCNFRAASGLQGIRARGPADPGRTLRGKLKRHLATKKLQSLVTRAAPTVLPPPEANSMERCRPQASLSHLRNFPVEVPWASSLGMFLRAISLRKHSEKVLAVQGPVF